jgi:hypothetical protein
MRAKQILFIQFQNIPNERSIKYKMKSQFFSDLEIKYFWKNFKFINLKVTQNNNLNIKRTKISSVELFYSKMKVFNILWQFDFKSKLMLIIQYYDSIEHIINKLNKTT